MNENLKEHLAAPAPRRDARRFRAAVITGPRSVGSIELPALEPDLGEVRIRVEGCGLCASNLPVWEGRPWFQYPLSPGAPGHEGWGTIDAVGPGVRGLSAGTRVTFLSDRAFAGQAVVPAAHTVVLPPALDTRPFPGEPLACAINAFRRSGIGPGEHVAIVGIGFLGAVLTRLSVRAGARVTALNRRTSGLATARAFGAEEAIPLEDPDRAAARARARTRDTGFDCVIEAGGVQQTLDVATRLTRERGRLIIAGYHQDGMRSVDLQLWNWRGLDVVNAHERDPQVYLEGMRIAVDAVASGELDPAPLYTHAFPLDRIADAFEALRTRPEGFVKALVIP